MKINFELNNIKVADKAEIGNVKIGIQYNAGELTGEYKLLKTVLKELPELIADLGTGAIAFEEMDKAMDKYVDSKFEPEATEETQAKALDIVKTAINKLRQAV